MISYLSFDSWTFVDNNQAKQTCRKKQVVTALQVFIEKASANASLMVIVVKRYANVIRRK